MDSATPAVVDTDVVSFLFKSHPLALAYQAILAGRPLAVSLIILAEIEYGMDVKNWGSGRRDLMRRFLGRFTPLLPDTETARLWARTKNAREKKGRPITFADAWIAAAALQLKVPLATHNASHFEGIQDLTVLTAPAAIQP
jgi:tRNA(fMet)-specific endonuclease VapC